jgi:ribosomal protein S18 acetylase RimI-like enzyme
VTDKITKSYFDLELKEKIFAGFHQAALVAKGMDGLAEPPIAFQLHRDGDFAGAVVVQMFWGQLHIKYLYVEESLRNSGYGRKLMDQAFTFGRERRCEFTFVETMSFQALRFYQKLGFEIEMVRHGYAADTSFYYLKKIL